MGWLDRILGRGGERPKEPAQVTAEARNEQAGGTMETADELENSVEGARDEGALEPRPPGVG